MFQIDKTEQCRERSSGRFRRRETFSVAGWLAAAILSAMTPSIMADSIDELRAASDSSRHLVQKAVLEENADALSTIFTENGCVVTPTGQTIRGQLTIRTMATLLMMTWGGGQLQVDRDSLMVRDSTGYEIGRFSFKRSPKNQPEQRWSGSYTVVWERENNFWKISRATGLMNQPRGKSKINDGH